MFKMKYVMKQRHPRPPTSKERSRKRKEETKRKTEGSNNEPNKSLRSDKEPRNSKQSSDCYLKRSHQSDLEEEPKKRQKKVRGALEIKDECSDYEQEYELNMQDGDTDSEYDNDLEEDVEVEEVVEKKGGKLMTERKQMRSSLQTIVIALSKLKNKITPVHDEVMQKTPFYLIFNSIIKGEVTTAPWQKYSATVLDIASMYNPVSKLRAIHRANPKKHFEIEEVPDLPQQSDMSDCAVYVCYYMKQLVLRREIHREIAEDDWNWINATILENVLLRQEINCTSRLLEKKNE